MRGLHRIISCYSAHRGVAIGRLRVHQDSCGGLPSGAVHMTRRGVSSEAQQERRSGPFTILALDGGGVRGVFTAALLCRIARECPSFLSSVDLLAGTSTGSILALMLAAGRTPEECLETYRVACPEIFTPRGMFSLPYIPSTPLWRSKYSNEVLRSFLKSEFGDQELGELERRVLITAFRVDGQASTTHENSLFSGHAIAGQAPALRWRRNPELPAWHLGTYKTWRRVPCLSPSCTPSLQDRPYSRTSPTLRGSLCRT